ncbi:MAG TPA: hypothetical protein PKX48_03440 [Planctomycetota bacterium]|jgi:hypothetical protein|nr:hypothetical protein [Planctomycetota bacterium]OQC20559.1 MAG: hypothetical protein BWX69_01755 [Planctomycetes bacterium ADurb.Bin069]HNR97915.1 hypothetical protein [Planctomycetota bacterium]HNU24559.1 hypothetical protein [Planctomycetota bacterium]HOE29050.1 hypothetical protein [Planctomycetota bacterium]
MRNVLGIPAAFLCAAACAAPNDKTTAVVEGGYGAIANAHLAIKIGLEAERARTLAITNRRTGEEILPGGEDFVLAFADGTELGAGAFRVERAAAEECDGGARLVVDLRAGGVAVRMITELGRSAWWATRRMEIQGPPGRLARISFGPWRVEGARGPAGPGNTVATLGYPSGCGQAVFVKDMFLAVAHPAAENFARDGAVACGLPAYDDLGPGKKATSREFLIGAGEAGDARRAFLKCIQARRRTPQRMIFLVNDWYWKDKSNPRAALEALAAVKRETRLPVDSFTLDDGWDFDWDSETGLWGRLNRRRFPGGWEALRAAGAPAGIAVSLWFGPIGGYRYRPMRVEFARSLSWEINGDKLCLAGVRYKRHVIESFARWAARGMDYIKVDGFWPNCGRPDHGHATGAGGAVAQMDALAEVFAAWRAARPDLAIGYTTGSNPSPFWLEHADYVWRGGADDSHAGAGDPFDRHTTFLDLCLQAHRGTDMPMSAFVTFDIVQHRIAGNSDAVFERGFWWLAARTSLHHDWYVQASDLTPGQWALLGRASRWAKAHAREFALSRMVGGDPGAGAIYGFAAWDGGAGTFALRNPSAEPKRFEAALADLLELPRADRGRRFLAKGVFGATQALEGAHAGSDVLRLELDPFQIAILEVARMEESRP